MLIYLRRRHRCNQINQRVQLLHPATDGSPRAGNDRPIGQTNTSHGAGVKWNNSSPKHRVAPGCNHPSGETAAVEAEHEQQRQLESGEEDPE